MRRFGLQDGLDWAIVTIGSVAVAAVVGERWLGPRAGTAIGVGGLVLVFLGGLWVARRFTDRRRPFKG